MTDQTKTPAQAAYEWWVSSLPSFPERSHCPDWSDFDDRERWLAGVCVEAAIAAGMAGNRSESLAPKGIDDRSEPSRKSVQHDQGAGTEIPEWVLVPRAPTMKMLNAAIDTDSRKLGHIGPLGFRCSPQTMFARCYAAMLATAPSQDTGAQSHD